MANNSWFLHVDLDAFFASVEQMDHPEYRGKPVIVGGLPTDRRSVVSTASYEARKYGVHSAMPTAQAYRLCPNGIYVHGNMRRYSELSYRIMTIFKDYSPDVDQMSIDEAFIDITGTEQLFGPPEQTAMEIKKKVKELTGLTVSIGLASTKYLAKIASGLSKPDGFYFIKPGNEQDFMLSLPLEKVWGLGSKSLEKLNKNGFYSTKDIFNKDLDYLEFLFGKNQASFLYNVVRGIEEESFSKKTKTHSISAETTYPFDVSDIYTIETTILELAHGVFFRLLREKGFSRTAFVKIRYEDFSTISIQRTYDKNISTLDTFYTKLSELFEEKYTENRGVRLIGIGFDNVVHEEKPFQQDLFETNESKKEKVEQAILKLSKKHPEIKVHKARLLKNTGKKIKSIAALLLSLTFCKEEIKAQTVYDLDINDKNKVEFELNGFWQGEIQETLNFNFTPPISSVFSAETPVFTQKVQLSAKAMLNKSLFFLVDFADEFKKNTFTFGYQGQNYLKEALLSNRNITMPDNYSSEAFGYGLSGGENQAPGLSLHFEDKYYQKWSMDFLFRYDMTSTESAVFYGMNTVNQIDYNINEFMYGNSYNIPSSDLLTSILSVYVESESGTITDSSGKKYRKLSTSDYMIYPETGKLILSSSAKAQKENKRVPSVLVTFFDTIQLHSFLSNLGNYSTPETYLGQIQDFFNKSGKYYNLSKYSYTLQRKIENTDALVIQNSQGFSPFLISNIYDCGFSKDGDVLVLHQSSEKESTRYSAELNFSETNINKDFFNDSHMYAKISNNDSSSQTLSSPENRFPFGDTAPEVYLNLIEDSDLKLVVRSYTPISDFYIDTKASAGTVKVYINGILDAGAKFTPETGAVTLGTTISQTDKIYITWSKDSSDFTSGNIAAGAGLIYNFLPGLKGDIAITTKLPLLTNNTYSSYENLHHSFAALSTGITYNKDDFIISDKTALALSSDDLTGIYSAVNNKNTKNNTYYLNAQDGYITKNIPNINLQLTQNNTVPLESKPSGVKDSFITGYKIPLSWDFSSLPYSSLYWSSIDIKLSAGDNLSNASEFEFALQPSMVQKTSSTKVYLQLGIKAENTFSGEDENIPYWEITDLKDSRIINSLDLENNNWQIVKIRLSDEDRSKLSANYDARIIVVSSDSDSKGTISAGPYEPIIQSIFVYHSDKISTSVDESLNFFSESVYQMKTGFNLSSVINWNYTDSSISADENQITAVNYFKNADFSSYRTVNFDFSYIKKDYKSEKNDSDSSFIFLLDSDARNSSIDGNIALRLELKDISQWIEIEEKYHTLSINVFTGQVFVDGQIISPENYILFVNKNIIPNREKIIFSTKSKNETIHKGSFYINSLYYKETNPDILVQNTLQTLYKNKTTDISISSSQYSSTKASTGNTSVNFDNTVYAKKQISSVEFSADSSFSFSSNYSKNQGLITSGHSIKTISPVMKIFSFEETYRFNRSEKSLLKANSFGTDFTYYNFPVSFLFSTTARDTTFLNNQQASGQLNIKLPLPIFSFDIKTSADFSQKINNRKNNLTTSSQDDYFSGWDSISKSAFSYGNENAYNRTVNYKASLQIPFEMIGIAPEVSYSLKNNYNNQVEITNQDITELEFLIPLTFQKNYFSLSFSKSLTGTAETEAGGNYESDTLKMFTGHSTHYWFYQIFPLQDFFDHQIKNNIFLDKLISQNSKSLLYSTSIEFLWKRKLFNKITDFFIPYSITAAAHRDICETYLQSDIYQFKLVLSQNAVTQKIELNSTLSALYKLPNNDIAVSVFTGTVFAEFLYYLSDYNTLRTAFDGTFSTDSDFDIKDTTTWERPGKTSFIVALTNFLFPSTQNISFNVSRKDSISVNFTKSGKTFTQKYELLHNSDLNFLKNYTVTLGLGGTFTNITDTATALGIILKFGLKMEF